MSVDATTCLWQNFVPNGEICLWYFNLKQNVHEHNENSMIDMTHLCARSLFAYIVQCIRS